MAGDEPQFLKIIWKLILSSINSQKIRIFCVWEGMVAIVFKTFTQIYMFIRVIHKKSNVKCLTSSSLILFILVIKYTMQNFSNFEKRLEGATGVLNFVHKVNRIFWSFLFRGPNMMMINLNVAKKLLDMCVLMLQNQWKKKKEKNLSQF